MQNYVLGTYIKICSSPNKKETKHQSKDTTNVQHEEPMSFTKVTQRNVNGELFKGA